MHELLQRWLGLWVGCEGIFGNSGHELQRLRLWESGSDVKVIFESRQVVEGFCGVLEQSFVFCHPIPPSSYKLSQTSI